MKLPWKKYPDEKPPDDSSISYLVILQDPLFVIDKYSGGTWWDSFEEEVKWWINVKDIPGPEEG